ncbi:MAG: hypothetical protein KY445_15880 [Armatimonadetes bacterium]|nr:hypothetical protein [Armatimonadota bacterium]
MMNALEFLQVLINEINPLSLVFYGVMLLFSLVFLVTNARAGHFLRELLSELRTLRPASYVRLTNPRFYNSMWRTNADLIELSRYLKSADDEDLEEIYQLKAQCRKWNRWLCVDLFSGAIAGIAIQIVRLIGKI